MSYNYQNRGLIGTTTTNKLKVMRDVNAKSLEKLSKIQEGISMIIESDIKVISDMNTMISNWLLENLISSNQNLNMYDGTVHEWSSVLFRIGQAVVDLNNDDFASYNLKMEIQTPVQYKDGNNVIHEGSLLEWISRINVMTETAMVNETMFVCRLNGSSSSITERLSSAIKSLKLTSNEAEDYGNEMIALNSEAGNSDDMFMLRYSQENFGLEGDLEETPEDYYDTNAFKFTGSTSWNLIAILTDGINNLHINIRNFLSASIQAVILMGKAAIAALSRVFSSIGSYLTEAPAYTLLDDSAQSAEFAYFSIKGKVTQNQVWDMDADEHWNVANILTFMSSYGGPIQYDTIFCDFILSSTENTGELEMSVKLKPLSRQFVNFICKYFNIDYNNPTDTFELYRQTTGGLDRSYGFKTFTVSDVDLVDMFNNIEENFNSANLYCNGSNASDELIQGLLTSLFCCQMVGLAFTDEEILRVNLGYATTSTYWTNADVLSVIDGEYIPTTVAPLHDYKKTNLFFNIINMLDYVANQAMTGDFDKINFTFNSARIEQPSFAVTTDKDRSDYLSSHYNVATLVLIGTVIGVTLFKKLRRAKWSTTAAYQGTLLSAQQEYITTGKTSTATIKKLRKTYFKANLLGKTTDVATLSLSTINDVSLNQVYSSIVG